MAFRHYKTKQQAIKANKMMTPKLFGYKKIRKSIRKTKKGWTASVNIRK